jgi:Right handed beta helix region
MESVGSKMGEFSANTPEPRGDEVTKRRHLMRKSAVLTLLVFAASLITLGAGQALAATFVVDDDLAQCPNADFTTAAGIQLAVNAASPGDDIKVCPGNYSSTTVTKALKLTGATKELKEKRCLDPTGNPATDPTKNSIVHGGPSAPGFLVAANDVEIERFTVQHAANDAGIRVPGNLSGTEIQENVIQDNTIGVNLNSNGVRQTNVEKNCIRDNNVAGAASGNGIYSDQGLANAQIDENTFFNNAATAINLLRAPLAGPLDNVRVRGNRSKDDGDLISIADSTNSEISHNRATGSIGSAIFITANNSDLQVQKNDLSDGLDEGINVNAGGGPVNTGLDISHNKSHDNATVGLAVRPDSLVSSVISNNKIEDNGADGIKIRPGNTGNLVKNNNMKGNGGPHDCHDASGIPPANTWEGNKGATQNQADLCKKATVVPPFDEPAP